MQHSQGQQNVWIVLLANMLLQTVSVPVYHALMACTVHLVVHLLVINVKSVATLESMLSLGSQIVHNVRLADMLVRRHRRNALLVSEVSFLFCTSVAGLNDLILCVARLCDRCCW